MATYAAYRHIELDKVGYSKKRVRNPPSDIFNVMSSSAPGSPQNGTPHRSRNNDSFNRLFGSPDASTPRRASLTKHESSPRNPVTGDGVVSWDSRPSSRNTPRPQRNPVTGEVYVVSPATTPTKTVSNGFQNGLQNGHGHEAPIMNGKA